MSSPEEKAPVVIDPEAVRGRLMEDPRVVTALSAFVGTHKSFHPDYAMGERVELPTTEAQAHTAAHVAARWAVDLTTIVGDSENGWTRANLRPERVQAYLDMMQGVRADG